MIDDSLFKDVYDEFAHHLNETENYRILFSGPFGVGKSTFIKFFFDQVEVADKFSFICISPINYSILSNEDIIKYLKYDILYNLVDLYPKSFESKYISTLKAAEVYFEYNYVDIIISLALIAPKYGRQAYKFLEIVKLKWNELLSLKEMSESQYRLSTKYARELESINGSIYENDAISEMIKNIIDENNENKKVVLVLDDIDRIDPNHIFRLFNVFSAHFDMLSSNTKTKFGFDHVIFVCDENNIRKLYQNLYGASIDYNGYIDKFYSKRIFQFNNKARLQLYIEKVIKNLNFDSSEVKITEKFKNPQEFYTTFLSQFTEELIRLGIVKIRNITKWERREVIIPYKVLYVNQYNTIQNYKIHLLLVFDLLAALFGNIDRVEEIFSILAKAKVHLKYFIEELLLDSIMIIDQSKHEFEKMHLFIHQLDEEREVKFRLIHTDIPTQLITIDNVDSVELPKSSLYEYLLKSLKYLKQINYY